MFENRPVSHRLMARRPGQWCRHGVLLTALLGAATLLLSSCDSAGTGTSAAEGNVSGSSSAPSASAKPGLAGNTGQKMFQPGGLTFIPSSGATTSTPNWKTKNACPAGHDASAELVAFNLQGDFESRISLPIGGAGPYTSAPGAGVLDFNLNKVRLYATPDVGPDGTIEVAVGCYAAADGLGSAVFVQSVFVHFSDNGASYTTSSSS